MLETNFQTFDDQYIPGRILVLDERHDVWQAAVRFTNILGGAATYGARVTVEIFCAERVMT